LIQHDESFEVQKGGVRAFYFDENATRHAVSHRVDKKTAFEKARKYLVG
jgi:hypothetical protein